MATKDQKKELRIVPAGVSTYFRIEYEGGGETPASLSGLWMSETLAEQAIRRHNAGVPVVRLAQSRKPEGVVKEFIQPA